MDTRYGELSIDRVENGVLIAQAHDLVRLTDDEIEPFIELLTAASRTKGNEGSKGSSTVTPAVR